MKLQNVTYSGILKNKSRIPEANIQAEFYRRCHQEGIRVLLEVKVDNCRFDALVFSEESPVAIVEIKNYSAKRVREGIAKGIASGTSEFKPRSTRQFEKYDKYGLPVIVIPGPDHVEGSIGLVQRVIELTKKA